MRTVTFLRFLTAIGAGLTTLASLDLTGIAPLFDDSVSIYLLAAGPAALCLKELIVVLGDWLDDGKPNKSFRIGLVCFAFAVLTLPFLAYCASPPPVSGSAINKDGSVTVHPDGRVELIVNPRTSK